MGAGQSLTLLVGHYSEEAMADGTRLRAAWACHTAPCHGGTAVTTAQMASKLAQIKAGGLEIISQFSCEPLRLRRECGNK